MIDSPTFGSTKSEMNTSVRLCPICGNDGPFYDTFKCSYCKPCWRARTRAKNNQDREAKRAKDRAYYHANKKKAAEDRRANYLANKERDQKRMAEWRKANPDGHRQDNLRRRARKAENGTEPYTRKEIFDRDRGICGICNLSVDLLLTFPHPGFFSIDHIIPITKGGPDTPENVQTSHLRCNIRKGNKE